MENYKFFEHKQCEYYPCHNLKEINCLFCHCPLMIVDCSEYGTPTYFTNNGIQIKDCSNCVYPHIRENYDDIINKLTVLDVTNTKIDLDKFTNGRING